jgi:MOSC domain-containing protein
VVDGDGRLAAGKDSRRFRRRDEVFRYAATTATDGTVQVSRGDARWPAGDPALDVELTTRFGDPVRVLPEDGVSHFDAGSVSIIGTATLDWCARELGVDADHRRLRANLLVESAEPFEEESWVGHLVDVGEVRLRVVERVERCRTIDLAQDGVNTTTPWLKALGRGRDLCIAVYADVLGPGHLAVGDLVRCV